MAGGSATLLHDKSPHSPPLTHSWLYSLGGGQQVRLISTPCGALGLPPPPPGGCLSLNELCWGWNILDGFIDTAGASAELAEQAGGCLGTSPAPLDPLSWAGGGSGLQEKGGGSWQAPKA